MKQSHASQPVPDDVANRRRQLRRWIDDHCGGIQSRFAIENELNAGEVSGLLKEKSFGEKRARSLETKSGMPFKYLEQQAGSVPLKRRSEQPMASAEPSADWPFRRVTHEQYSLLSTEQRDHIEQSVLMMLPPASRKVPIKRRAATS